jgi:putative oxygen-independent coproporphyrinogen III oxidase
MTVLQHPPISLYIHLPWCIKKCPYCDFNSHASNPSFQDQEHYITHLIHDLTHDIEYLQGRTLHTIFIGGGTPSLFSGEHISTLLERIANITPLSSSVEITLEANPGALNLKKLQQYKSAGVNRISLGIQSFNTDHLNRLGRIHNASDAKQAIDNTLRAGFDRFNIDLMYGLPTQSIDGIYDDLNTALSFQPTHLSWYQLTLEPNTAFYTSPPKYIPDDNLLSDMSDVGVSFLNDAKLIQYEISAFATEPHYQAQHNINYWSFGDYIGIGAGAHGKITHLSTQEIIRTQKTRSPKDYLNNSKPYTSVKAPILKEDLIIEFFMNTLRMNAGFSLNSFEQRTGLSRNIITPKLKCLIDKGLIISNKDRYYTSALGQKYLNTVLVELSSIPLL